MTKSNTKTAEAIADNMQDSLETSIESGSKMFKDTMDQNVKFWGDMQALGQKNMDAWMKASTIMMQGGQKIVAQASESARTSFEGNMKAAKSLASAKSAQEAMELQSQLMQDMASTFMAEAKKIGDVQTKVAQEVFETVSERMADGMKSVA